MQFILTQEELDGLHAEIKKSNDRAFVLAGLLSKAKAYPCIRNEYCNGCEIERQCPILHHYPKG